MEYKQTDTPSLCVHVVKRTLITGPSVMLGCDQEDGSV